MTPFPSPLLAAQTAACEFLDEATAGGTRLRAPLRIEVLREITSEDLASGFLTPPRAPTLRDLKASHHTLAKLLAAGRSNVEASRITGYTPGYVSRIRGDPSFSELILHYTQVEEIAATDFLGAMRGVGMDALDELRKRYEENPSAFSITQIHDTVKLLLLEPAKIEALQGGSGGSGGPIRISFVSAGEDQGSPRDPSPPSGPIIEGDLVE